MWIACQGSSASRLGKFRLPLREGTSLESREHGQDGENYTETDYEMGHKVDDKLGQGIDYDMDHEMSDGASHEVGHDMDHEMDHEKNLDKFNLIRRLPVKFLLP